MDASFDHRSWSIGKPAGLGPFRGPFHAFLVTRGAARLIATNSETRELTAPFLLWLPHAASGEFRLMAGGEGFTLTVAEEFVWRAASDSAVALHLRPLFDRTVVAASDRLFARLAELRMSFEALVRESHDQEPSSAAICAAHLALILIHLWRAADLAALAIPLRGTAAGTAQRFRQLVELHFRENLRIDDYARKLLVTRAHLHEACLRALERTPLAIIHDRLVEEAKGRLEQSELSVEQVGYSLGFRDPAYFNRFFKRKTGKTPAAFRLDFQATPSPHAAPSFAAWP